MRAFVLMLAMALPAVPGHASSVTACGDSVPAGEIGDLMNDLTCPPGTFAAVFLGDGATLNLNGFQITGDGQGVASSSQGQHSGVSCGSVAEPPHVACTVNGPGEITNAGVGIDSVETRRVVVSNVTLRGNGIGLWAGFSTLSITNVVADENTQLGVVGDRVTGSDVETNDNGDGGVAASRAVITRLTATGNGRSGGLSQIDRLRAAKLTDSTLTGNNGFGQGYDILWNAHVRLRGTVCGKSGRVNRGVVVGTYHVCTDD